MDGPYDEQLKSLLHGRIDLIIGALRYPAPSPGVVQEQLFSDPLCIVTRAEHPLTKNTDLAPAQLQALRWVAPRPGTPARDVFASYFNNAGIAQPETVIECSSLASIRGLLMNSDLVALLPRKQVEFDLATGSLAISPQPLSGTSRDIGLTYRKTWVPTTLQQRFSNQIRAVVDHLFIE